MGSNLHFVDRDIGKRRNDLPASAKVAAEVSGWERVTSLSWAGGREATRMASRKSWARTLGLAALALLGTVGAFVFGVLAGEGGKGHLRNIFLGVVCVAIPAIVTAISRFVANRALRTEVEAREHAVEEREQALLSKEEAERQTTEVQITAEARLIFALRARLSPVLYCLGKIASSSSGTQVAPLIGSLTQAIVSAAIERRDPAETRRSVFFAAKGDLMECVSYAGYEGQQDAALTVFRNNPTDPVGQRMFRLLRERGPGHTGRGCCQSSCEVPEPPELSDDHRDGGNGR